MKCPILRGSPVEFVAIHTVQQECSQGMVWPFGHSYWTASSYRPFLDTRCRRPTKGIPPSPPLHGHFWTAISGPPFPDANLRRPDQRILPTFCQVLCNFLRSSLVRFLIPSSGWGSLPALRSGSLALCGAQVPPLG